MTSGRSKCVYALPCFPIAILICFFLPTHSIWADPCKDLKKRLNQNALLSVREYLNPNDRLLHQYERNLPKSFQENLSKLNTRWCDSGSGWGLAGIGFASKRADARVTTINAQDNWGFLRELDNDDPYAENLKGFFVRAYSAFGLNSQELVEVHEHLGPLYNNNWQEIGKNRILGALKNLEDAGRLKYQVGMAEDVLKGQGSFDVISDFFGTYYYSADRLTILNQYYKSLSSTGVGYIVLGSTDYPFGK